MDRCRHSRGTGGTSAWRLRHTLGFVSQNSLNQSTPCVASCPQSLSSFFRSSLCRPNRRQSLPDNVARGHDWTQFGFDDARTSVSTAPTGIDEKNVASDAPPAGHARRHRGRVGHLPERRTGQRRAAQCVVRDDDLRQDDRDQREYRRDPLDLHAAGLSVVDRITPDHELDAGRRPGPRVHLRGIAGRPHREARRRRRPRGLEHRRHLAPAEREGRLAAQLLRRPRHRRDRRLHRRRAAVSGPRRDSRCREREAPPRMELALQRSARES